ncbi:TRAP transporter substrate-binding protein DctP [Afifella pfennigii]|uniref:TRAP transporter substrate-binding protein DctP n=1 Tax=Afifella pfennigii TaxID=209897 RepID=UPI00068B8591|nr:TRAP transporter substrate-binding protein DctP [Afifella pfennigii]
MPPRKSPPMLAPALALALAFCLVGPAGAATLKAGLTGPNQEDSFHRQMLERLKRVAEDGEPALSIAMPAAETQARPAELRRALASGRIDIAALPLAAAGGDSALTAALLPGLVRDLGRAKRLSRSAFAAVLRERAEAAGLVVLADAWLSGGIVSADACIGEPASLSGKTLHAEAPALRTLLVKSGAAVAETPRARLAEAMAGGVIDGAFASSETLLQEGLTTTVKCLTAPGEAALFVSYEPIVMAKPAFEALGEEEQKALKAAGQKVAEWAGEAAVELEDELTRTYAAAGVKVEEMDRAAFDQWLAVAKESAFRDLVRDSDVGKRLIDEAISLN